MHKDQDQEDWRLQKILAASGYGSRRELERWIRDERILINQEIAKLGDRVGRHDKVEVDGRPARLVWPEDAPLEGLMMNKLEGVVCTRKDEKDRPTIFDDLEKPRRGRWINVGRLDINSQGLIVFVNDGALAAKMMHPRYQWLREYQVRILGILDQDQMRALKKGVELEDGWARFDSIKSLDEERGSSNHWYSVTLREGRQREVRRMFEHFDIRVSRLIRTRFGPIKLPKGLRRGLSRQLTAAELEMLNQHISKR